MTDFSTAILCKAILLNFAGFWAASCCFLLVKGCNSWQSRRQLFAVVLLKLALVFLCAPWLPRAIEWQAAMGHLTVSCGFPAKFEQLFAPIWVSLSLGASPINVADLIVDALGQPLAAVLGRLLILWSLLATTQFLSQTWWLRRRFLRTRTAHHCNGLQFWITPGFASMAFGIFRPEVILSQRDAAAPTVERDAVLAHELAHIERNDPLKSWLLGLLLSLVPFVLPLRWLVTHVRNGFEGAADELAVARGVSARSMAATLFKRAQPRAIHWAPSLDGGALYERIVVLLDKAEGRPPQEKQGSKILLGLSMLFILGVHWM